VKTAPTLVPAHRETPSDTGQREAAQIAHRFVQFVQEAHGYQDLSPNKVEAALGVRLRQNKENYGYGIADIGAGWTFAI